MNAKILNGLEVSPLQNISDSELFGDSLDEAWPDFNQWYSVKLREVFTRLLPGRIQASEGGNGAGYFVFNQGLTDPDGKYVLFNPIEGSRLLSCEVSGGFEEFTCDPTLIFDSLDDSVPSETFHSPDQFQDIPDFLEWGHSRMNLSMPVRMWSSLSEGTTVAYIRNVKNQIDFRIEIIGNPVTVRRYRVVGSTDIRHMSEFNLPGNRSIDNGFDNEYDSFSSALDAIHTFLNVNTSIPGEEYPTLVDDLSGRFRFCVHPNLISDRCPSHYAQPFYVGYVYDATNNPVCRIHFDSKDYSEEPYRLEVLGQLKSSEINECRFRSLKDAVDCVRVKMLDC